jgi:hypothetical protein
MGILAGNSNRDRRTMKSKIIAAVLGLALGTAIPLIAEAASSGGVQVPIPTTAKEVPGPFPATR